MREGNGGEGKNNQRKRSYGSKGKFCILTVSLVADPSCTVQIN